jgi:MFS family permease
MAITAIYLAFAVAFSLLTPAWENNDETSHVQYVEHVVAHWAPPRIAPENGIESHQPPLYYYVEALWQRLLGIEDFTVDPPPANAALLLAPYSSYFFEHDYNSAQHEQAVWVHQLRLASIACGLAAVLAGLATGWLLSGRLPFAAAVAATVALWPKFLVVSGAITNTVLVDALCAVAVPCFLMWHRSRRAGWALATGAVLGAAALTQETALPVAGLVLALLVVLAWGESDWRAPLLAIAGFAVICGWWYVRNAVLYGDPLASQESRAYLTSVPRLTGESIIRDPPSLSPDVVWSSLKVLGHSTWYNGSWSQLQLPHALDFVVWGAALVCIAAALWSRLRYRLLLAACVLGGFIAWLMIIRVTTLSQGRYLLVAIVAWAALLVAGSAQLGRYRVVSFWVWPTIMLGLDVYVLAHWLIPKATL